MKRTVPVLLILITLVCATATLAAQLHHAPSLPAITFDYSVQQDPSMSAFEPTPKPDAVDSQIATLGRVLFYDRNLSANGLVSCGSCHSQETGFDDRSRFSIGFEGRITERSAMPLGNARYNPSGRYFRDARAASLEDQVLDPFTDEIEMGLKPGELIERVATRDWYAQLFRAAFGTPEISRARIAHALADFVRAMTANQSRYDTARAAATSPTEVFPTFTRAENRGKFLFFTDVEKGGAGCANCHQSDAFIMIRPENNGLDAISEKADPGLGGISGRRADMGRFRAASLKNIELTAPYMHDGRLATLAQVIDHYDSGVKPHPNLSKALVSGEGGPIQLGLSDDDKSALIAFLITLTDRKFVADERFSNPFLVPKGTFSEE